MLPAGVVEQRVGPDNPLASAGARSVYVWALYEANELDAAEAVFSQPSRHHQRIVTYRIHEWS